MSDLRRLQPLVLPKNTEKVNPGSSPQPILLKVSQLRINDQYQRQLSRDSSRMAMKIAKEFDWELYHLLVVSPLNEVDEITGLPLYEVLDGQHTGIGAITNGNITELWCWPGRKDESVESRAESFNKLNTQRTSVTSVELFWAKVTAKDENALEVLEACERTGAKIVKRTKPYGDMAIGETICTVPLMILANKGGRPYVQRVLKVAVDLRLAPISLVWIQALEQLLLKPNSPHYVKGLPATMDLEIVNAVGRIGIENIFYSAKKSNLSTALKDRQPVYWWIAYYIKKEITDHARSK